MPPSSRPPSPVPFRPPANVDVRCSRRRFQPSTHHRTGRQPCLLKRDFSIPQNNEVRDATHAEARREIGQSFRVDLQDHRTPRHLSGQRLHLRRSHPAGTTPRRPKVHQHRYSRLARDLLELSGRGHIQRLRERRQRSFTRAAPTRICKVACRNTIARAATSTCSNHLHLTQSTDAELLSNSTQITH